MEVVAPLQFLGGLGSGVEVADWVVVAAMLVADNTLAIDMV
jgi:hypothetical protein